MAEPRKRNTGRPGALSLMEALALAGQNFEASQKPGKPFDLQATLQGADKAIQQGVFGVTDAIGSEGKRLIDGKFGFDALSQAIPQLAQSGPQNLAEALATTRQGGAQWTNQDLQAQRDRDNLGKAGGGALDATWLLPAVPAAKAGVRAGTEALGSMLPKRAAAEAGPEIFQYGDGLVDMRLPVGSGEPATLSGSLKNNRLSVDYMNVPEAAQRQGVGTKMHDALIEWGKKNGVEAIDSDSVLSPGATALYESLQRKGYGVTKNAEPRMAGESSIADGPIYSLPVNKPDPTTRVYHGTNSTEDFAVPSKFSRRDGVSVALDPQKAGQYGSRILPLNLSGKIAQPSDLSAAFDAAGNGGFSAAKDILKQKGFTAYIATEGDHPIVLDTSALSNALTGERLGAKGSGSPTTLSAGFGFGGKDGEKPILNALMDAFRGKQAPANPLDQFTPPTSLDDIFTGGPRGPRTDTGPLDPRQPEGPAFNASTPEVGYDGNGFTGLDQQFTQAKNRNTLLEALAKREQKPLGYDDWSEEWRAAFDKGLPMDQASRMARMQEQGFEGPFYHGMPRQMNGDTFRTSSPRERNFFATSDPQTADHYAADGGNLLNGGPDFSYNEGAATYPVMIRNGEKFGGPEAEIMARDPANIRSTSAAFDPANAGKPNLLGAGSPFDSDLIKLLMAYGAFGGMSAGALATMDAQQKAPAANHRGF